LADQDEPTASLDMISKDQLASTFLSVKQAAPETVTLLVTHDREFCLRVADSIAVIDRGTMVWSGLTTQLFVEPGDARVYETLGTSVSLFGVMRNGMLHVAGDGHSYPDMELMIRHDASPPERQVTLVAPRNCVKLYKAGTISAGSLDAVLIGGTIMEESIASGGGGFQYNVRLLNGTLWHGIRPSDYKAGGSFTIDSEIQLRIPLPCVRLLRAPGKPERIQREVDNAALR
jgi:ABC-type sugar transport system ATPase subunit